MSDLDELITHFQIVKALGEYCHGCDRLDQEEMASVYADESWDDHGQMKGPGREFAALSSAALGATSNSCWHQLGQSLIKVDGEEAGAETYFLAALRVASSNHEILHQMGGRYVDTLQRTDGKWKIKKRICIRDWSISHAIKDDFLRGNPFVEGRRSNADASYTVLGIAHSGRPTQAEIRCAELADGDQAWSLARSQPAE